MGKQATPAGGNSHERPLRELRDVEVFEVSLVGAPANRRKFLLFKSDDESEGGDMSDFLNQLEEELREPAEKTEAEGQATEAEVQEPEAQPEAAVATEPEASAGTEAEAEAETEAGPEAGEPEESPLPEAEPTEKLSQKAKDAIKRALKVLWEVRAELPKGLLTNLGALVGYPAYGYPQPAKKSELPAEVKKQLDALFKEREELLKRLERAEEIAKAERDLRLTKEFIAKAEDELPALPIKPEEFGPVLKQLHELDEGLYEKVFEVLKSTNELLAKGEFFKEIGSSVEQPASAREKLKAKAEELMKANPGMSRAEAYERVIKSEPELYYEYEKELKE